MQDAVIVAAVRSPGGRYRKGGLAQTRSDEIAIQVIRALMARVPEVKPEMVDDLMCGCAFPEAEQGMNIGRVVSLGAGLPITTCGMTVNRFCSSGLQAIADATATVRAGWAEIVIAGGTETMTHIPMGGSIFRPHPDWGTRPNTYVSMGITAEEVAKRFDISRADQDALAVESNRRAHEAIDKGRFNEQITPIEAWKYIRDARGRRVRETMTFAMDDGVRWPTTMESLAQLKPVFRDGGSVTAGNSSQMTDGAAFVMVMSAAMAEKLGLSPLARLTHFAVGGVDPEIMGVGPAVAVPKVLKLAGLKTTDIDVFEINEAFASQCLYSLRQTKLEKRYEKGDINPNGGAIALGHPLGCTGAKLTTQLLYELHRRGGSRGIVSMCIGGGMGAAGVFEMLGGWR
ncbi:MAG: thiolase family protein [Deltaproteobacteria bacterium]|nr:thiolase family protein [Candidatus Anaeroferrophillacea bacterium]